MVSKYCSILNYLRHHHEDVHELIQDLCIGRYFKPRKDQGVTFLCPDGKLVAELKAMAAGSDPEKAVDVIRSLVITDVLNSPGDLEGDLPTALNGHKLVVESSNAKEAKLAGGAVVSEESNWDVRGSKDRPFLLSVLKLSGSFPKATAGEAGKKVKKGGAAMKGSKRQDVFEHVLSECCKTDKRDPAMELLVSLVTFLQEQKDGDVCKRVCSQLSGDTLASLAIILRPYAQNGTPYVDEVLWGKFCNEYHHPELPFFCVVPNPGELYNNFMKEGAEALKGSMKDIENQRNQVLSNASTATITGRLTSAYHDLAQKSLRGVQVNSEQLLCEGELRVLSALLHISYGDVQYRDAAEFLNLFKNQCNLDKPYLNLGRNPNPAFYYSTYYLLARSDGFYFVPDMDGNSLIKNPDSVVNEENLILLAPTKVEVDDKPYEVIANMHKAIAKSLAEGLKPRSS